MEYGPGKQQMNADCFSRLPLPTTESADPEDRILMIEEVGNYSVLSAKKITEWARRDTMLAHVHEYFLRGWSSENKDPDLATYRVRKDELSVQDSCVLWGARVVIPPHERSQVMAELYAAHSCINIMKGLTRSHVWWPGMDIDIENLVRKCTICQEHQNISMSAPLHPWEYSVVHRNGFIWIMHAHTKGKCS